VVTATIDKYCYALLSPTNGQSVQFATSDYEGLVALEPSSKMAGQTHPAAFVLDYLGIRRGVSVFMTSELPPHTGMAAYSAGVVALIRTVAELRGQRISPSEIAELACQIEIEKMGSALGKQNAYSTALGGLNLIEFDSQGVRRQAIHLDASTLHAFEERLMLFFTGRFEQSPRVLAEYRRATERNRATVVTALHQIKEAAIGLHRELETGNLETVGHWLNQSWSASRNLAPGMTDPWVDQWYEMARSAGATGGGTAGLGATGFIFLYCEPDRQKRVEDELDRAGLKRVEFRLAFEGVALILNEQTMQSEPAELPLLAGARNKRVPH